MSSRQHRLTYWCHNPVEFIISRTKILLCITIPREYVLTGLFPYSHYPVHHPKNIKTMFQNKSLGGCVARHSFIWRYVYLQICGHSGHYLVWLYLYFHLIISKKPLYSHFFMTCTWEISPDHHFVEQVFLFLAIYGFLPNCLVSRLGLHVFFDTHVII